MKTLYLIRHAKSSWDFPNLSDFERPLNERGQRDAPFMGKLLSERIKSPQIIYSSPAKRAITTAEIIAEFLGYDVNSIIKNENIYEAAVSDLMRIINNNSDEYSSLMLFGHNPGFTLISNYLADKKITNLPTCGFVQIDFNLNSWNNIEGSSGNLMHFEYPKKYINEEKIKNRDLSWLSFNYRVLQEAKDPNVPLFERIKFLAIYSSNLDEFFRVRVAGLRSILNVGKKTQQELNIEPVKILSEISKIVNKHQVELRQIFKTQIIPELSKNNINLIDDSKVTAKQKLFIKRYFEERVVPQIQPILLVKNRIVPFLRNRRLYLAVKLKSLESKAKKEYNLNMQL